VREEIRLAGFGGQGIILAGMILGKAAAIYDGNEAVFSQSYGPEARGGACAAEVIICDYQVDYPLFEAADVAVAMSQEAFHKYGSLVKPEGIILLDSDLVHADAVKARARSAPFTRIAEGLGNKMAANVVMLGFLTGATEVVSRKAMEESIRTTVRARFVDLNLRAFAQGFELAKEPEAVR